MYGCEIMAIEFRTAFIGFNKDDVLNYIRLKDSEIRTVSDDFKNTVASLEKELSNLKAQQTSALAKIEELTEQNLKLKEKADEFDRKSAEIDSVSNKIGKLYMVSKSYAKDMASNAKENSKITAEQTEQNLKNIEIAQASLKEVAESILSASHSFVERLDTLQEHLSSAKSKVSENEHTVSKISDDFAEIYAKLG